MWRGCWQRSWAHERRRRSTAAVATKLCDWNHPKASVALFRSSDRSTLKRSFADHVEKSEPGDSGRSRVGTNDRGKIVAERLHAKVANQRSQSLAEV